VKFVSLGKIPKGLPDTRTAGDIIAAAFAGQGATRMPRGFGGKDPRRLPISARYQACLLRVFADARQAKRDAAARKLMARCEELK
jgi:hypothetical protein